MSHFRFVVLALSLGASATGCYSDAQAQSTLPDPNYPGYPGYYAAAGPPGGAYGPQAQPQQQYGQPDYDPYAPLPGDDPVTPGSDGAGASGAMPMAAPEPDDDRDDDRDENRATDDDDDDDRDDVTNSSSIPPAPPIASGPVAPYDSDDGTDEMNSGDTDEGDSGFDADDRAPIAGAAPQAEAPADPYAPYPPPGPGQPGDPTTSVSDQEINAALDSHGQWIETEEYGPVWRPYGTVVGPDFTPYETAGSWVYTDAGWSFASEYSWGWLPFHYGRWAYFNDYWGWVPGRNWSPAWVEWRHGGGVVGWRPLAPRVRDPRYAHFHRFGAGNLVRDHRRAVQRDNHWRFSNDRDFGRRGGRVHSYRNPSTGLRMTSSVKAPPLRGRTTVRSADVMRSRPVYGRAYQATGRRGYAQPRDQRYGAPSQSYPRPAYRPPAPQGYRQPQSYPRPAYRPPAQQGYRQPYTAPSPTYQRPGYRPPAYRPPTQGYQPPTSAPAPVYQPRPSYRPPSPQGAPQSYQRPAYRPPSPPSAPSGSFSPPPRSAPSGSFSPPPRSSAPPARTSPPPSSNSSRGSHSAPPSHGGRRR